MPSRTKTATAPAREPPALQIDNYFDDFEDAFASDTDGGGDKHKNEKSFRREEADAGLGIDEEVQVKKRARAPRVKLDETRSVTIARA
jgi:replication fork protection complex subunit Csm3/Swi3